MATTAWFNGWTPGHGCNPQTGQLLGKAISFSPAQPIFAGGGQTVTFRMEKITDRESLSKRLSIDASLTLKGVGWGASAEASYMSSTNFNNYYLYMLLSVSVENPEEQISDEVFAEDAINLINSQGWDAFNKVFGKEYIRSFVRGGTYYALFEFKTTDEQRKQAISASLNVNYGIVDFKAKFKSTFESSVQKTTFNIQSFRAGGSGAPISVSIDEMLEEAINFPETVKKSPVPIRATTQEYVTLNPPKPLGDFALQMVNREQRLKQAGIDFNNLAVYIKDIQFIIENLTSIDDFKSLDPSQIDVKKDEFNAEINRAKKEMDAIVNSASLCYNDISKCQFYITNFVQKSLPNLNSEMKTLKELEDKVSILENKLIYEGQDAIQALLAQNHYRFTEIQSLRNDLNGQGQNMQVKLRYQGGYRWVQGQPPVKLGHFNQGFAVLTHVSGDFEGGGEPVWVGVKEDGYWYLGGKSQQGGIAAEAIFVTVS
jgi:hypothetical protein